MEAILLESFSYAYYMGTFDLRVGLWMNLRSDDRQPVASPLALACSPGRGGYFFDDQAAIKAGAERDGVAYVGSPITAGYGNIREPAETVSVMLMLAPGSVAYGDCASVQYSGVGGREPRLDADATCVSLESLSDSILECVDVSDFRHSAARIEALVASTPTLGAAAVYGLTQAALSAVAQSTGQSMARVVISEWDLDASPLAAVPIYAQCGEDRYTNVDKMILKNVDVIPHGLINHPSLIGEDGRHLYDYIRWIGGRIDALRPGDEYLPPLHIDTYGLLGAIVGGDIERVADLLITFEEAAGRHSLRIEHPVDAGSRDGQVEAMAQLRTILKERGSTVLIVADEWANTLEDIRTFAAAGAADLIQVKTPDLGSIANSVEAVLACDAAGVGAIIGGTCTETEVSARASVHIALATRAAQVLAKPGMGVDEGLMIVTNEMNRAIRLDHLTSP